MTLPRAHQITGHRVDFVVDTRLFLTRAFCQCGWASDWWDRAQQASEQWRVHAGVDG